MHIRKNESATYIMTIYGSGQMTVSDIFKYNTDKTESHLFENVNHQW